MRYVNFRFYVVNKLIKTLKFYEKTIKNTNYPYLLSALAYHKEIAYLLHQHTYLCTDTPFSETAL